MTGGRSSRWRAEPMRWLSLLLLFAVALAGAQAAAPIDVGQARLHAELRTKPITTARGEVGDLLRGWWKEGTAAGNVGDFYDNRDGKHSDLDTSPYPQLQRFKYTP